MVRSRRKASLLGLVLAVFAGTPLVGPAPIVAEARLFPSQQCRNRMGVLDSLRSVPEVFEYITHVLSFSFSWWGEWD